MSINFSIYQQPYNNYWNINRDGSVHFRNGYIVGNTHYDSDIILNSFSNQYYKY